MWRFARKYALFGAFAMGMSWEWLQNVHCDCMVILHCTFLTVMKLQCTRNPPVLPDMSGENFKCPDNLSGEKKLSKMSGKGCLKMSGEGLMVPAKLKIISRRSTLKLESSRHQTWWLMTMIVVRSWQMTWTSAAYTLPHINWRGSVLLGWNFVKEDILPCKWDFKFWKSLSETGMDRNISEFKADFGVSLSPFKL